MFNWRKLFGREDPRRRRRTFEANRTDHPAVPLQPRQFGSPLPALPSQGTMEAAYSELREQALRGTSSASGLHSSSMSTEPWGILMETGFRDESYTLVALSDGSASIYLSNGGGCIGGRRHENIRNAAQSMVELAARFQPEATATTICDLPKNGRTVFYFLTAAGIFMAEESEEELSGMRHAWSPLFQAGQEVIKQYRVIENQHKPKHLSSM